MVSSWRKWFSTKVRGGGEQRDVGEPLQHAVVTETEGRRVFEDCLPMTYAEVFDALLRLSGSHVHVWVNDLASGAVPVHAEGSVSLGHALPDEVVFQVGKGTKFFIEEGAFTGGRVDPGGITARCGGLEVEVNRFPEPESPPRAIDVWAAAVDSP